MYQLVLIIQGDHPAAKVVKIVDFKRKAVKAVKLHIFLTIWLQKLHYCLVPMYISFSMFLKMLSLKC